MPDHKSYIKIKLPSLKKLLLSLTCIGLFSFASNAQLMVSKLVGKGASKFGLGYENQSFRIELIDFAFFPTKGENFFTSTADAKGYLSIKLGYKYVFSETHAGFYLLPSAGYCMVIIANEGEDLTHGDGIAGALEGGYSLEVGQRGNTLNFGLKYEYDYGNATHIIQSVGFRVSYAFGLFRKKE
jgi:hypothetical protein